MQMPTRTTGPRTLMAVMGMAVMLAAAGCGTVGAHTGSSSAPPAYSASSPASVPSPTGGLSAPASASPAPIKVYGNCTRPSVEPSEIVLACADDNALLTGLHWTSWTATSATAAGTLEYNDCSPNCAAGHFRDVPGTHVTLTAPVQAGNGLMVWSRVQESPEPPGYRTGPYHGGPQPLTTRPLVPHPVGTVRTDTLVRRPPGTA